MSVDAMTRATYAAWLATAVLGLLGGVIIAMLRRLLVRITRMRVASTFAAAIVGAFLFAALHVLRYRIEEAPFEPPAWIHPGMISLYLPAAALVAGFVLTSAVNSRLTNRV